MSVKSKKMRKIARNAAMSALIVSAIVGTGVMASAATTDNVSRISSGTVSTSSYTVGTATASALEVTGGTLYVDSNYSTNNKVLESNTKAVNLGDYGTNTNAWIKGGSVIMGMKSDGTAAAATLTVDNMTIDNGLVAVNNYSSIVADKNIDINGGTLQMSSGANLATVKAANVNINSAGTLYAKEGVNNLIQASGAVNLNGGTITVAKTAGLTIGDFSTSAADADAIKGHMVVGADGKFNSMGGTINAGLVSKGATNFKGGTTTVDNLTVADGTTTIEGNATVNSKGSVEVKNSVSVLEMKGGTLRVLDPAGAVNVQDQGTLKASAGVNTVDAKVNVTGGGIVSVTGAASLTITKDLLVTGANSKVDVIGTNAQLILKGSLTTDATGKINVGDNSTGKGSLTAGYGAVTASTVNGSSIVLGTNGPALNGTLIVTDYGKDMTVAGSGNKDATDLTAKTSGGVLGDNYANNNVIIWGQNLIDASGEFVEAISNGAQSVKAGVNVAITGGELKSGAQIIAPSVTTSTGSLELTGGSSLNLVGVGMGDASNKTTDLDTLKLNGGSASVTNGAGLNAGILDMTTGGLDVINSSVNVGTLKATDGTIFVDPAIVNIGTIQDNDLKNVSLLTGAGSLVTLGGAQGWMDKPMKDAGFAFNDTTKATLGIAPTGTIKIDATGNVVVDPAITVATKGDYERADANVGAFRAGANTLTVLDVSGLDGDPVFKITKDTAGGANNDVNIVAGAKLHVSNLTVDGVQIFTMADGSNATVKDGAGAAYDPTNANAGWADANLIQPDRMLTKVGINADGMLTADAASASSALGMSTEFNGLMAGVWGNALNNTNSGNAGIRFVSRAASSDFGLSADQAAKAIEGAAQMAAVAGVQGVTISAANSATSAVATRTSFAQPLLDKTKAVALNMGADGSVSLDSGLSAGNGMKNGLGLWIMPLYQSNRVWGQEAGNFKSGYNSDLGGIAAGVDYTVNDMFRFGAALNIGAGYSKSDGDFSDTDNSFNFWGVNLYGGWTMNNFGVSADVGYTGNYNKVEQDAPAALGMSNFKSDINSSALTAGLKAEYKIETSVLDIIPHVGVRYMGLTTDEYSVKSNGTAFKVDQDFQSIWTFPIGVTMSKNIDMNSGWVFKPQLDLSVIPAAGDVEAKSKSRIPGAPGSVEAKMQVVDYVTFDGGVGFDIGNENLTFGLNYNIQASEHRTGHGVFGTVRYEF